MRDVWQTMGATVALLLLSVMWLAACSVEYPECHRDGDCRYDGRVERCLNGTCQQCRDDGHCASLYDDSHVCEQGACVKIAGYCAPPVHPCPDGTVCRDSRCGPECLGDSECPDRGWGPYACKDGRCVPLPPDCPFSGCPALMTCTSRGCVDAPIPVFRLGFDFEETTLTLEAREQIALAMDFHNTEVEQSRWSTGVDVYLVCGPPDDSAQSERTRRDVLRYSAISKSLVSHGLLEDHITRAAWERGDDGAPNTMCYLTWRRAR